MLVGAQPGSDIDLGILYSEAAPFSIQSVREVAGAVNDTVGPVVTGFYEWGDDPQRLMVISNFEVGWIAKASLQKSAMNNRARRN